MSDLDRHIAITVEVYKLPDNRLFAHPPDEAVCNYYHSRGKECPCESGAFIGHADIPPDWRVELHPPYWEPDAIVTHHLKTMTIMIPDSEIDCLPDWQQRVEPYVPPKEV